jgi:hypothetical protein
MFPYILLELKGRFWEDEKSLVAWVRLEESASAGVRTVLWWIERDPGLIGGVGVLDVAYGLNVRFWWKRWVRLWVGNLKEKPHEIFGLIKEVRLRFDSETNN